MTTKEAKENVIKNYREQRKTATGLDMEIFLRNTMEQLEQIVRKEIVKMIINNTNNNQYRDGETAFDIVKDIKTL